MRAKIEAQEAVKQLRRQGLSYKEILQQVPVSKSSLSLWCRTVTLDPVKQQLLRQRQLTAGQNGLAKIAHLRQAGTLIRVRRSVQLRTPDPREIECVKHLYYQERLSVHQVALRMGTSFWHVYDLMRRNGILRRKGTEQNYAASDQTKPKFSALQLLTPEDERLRAVGSVLYRAEGAKTGHVVDFTNSDPLLIKVFLAFLRRVCGVAEPRLRVLLYCYADQDVVALRSYWSSVTNIPLKQFTRPYVRSLTPNVSRRKMPWGLVHIRYADKRLLHMVLAWSRSCVDVGAGT